MVRYEKKPEEGLHRLELKSCFEELEGVYVLLDNIVAGFPDKDVLKTCLHEIAANAIEHGNKFDADKSVIIELSVEEDCVTAKVEDQGEGFNWAEKINKPMDFEGLSERGRGIPMTRILSGNLYYNVKGNRVTLLVEAGKVWEG